MRSYARLYKSAAVIVSAALMTAAQAGPGSAREFTVQVLACSDNATAQKAKAGLQKKGLDAYIEQFEGGAATAYRVRIGKFPSLEGARQVQKHLRERGMDSWIARTGPAEPAQRHTPASAGAASPDTATIPSGSQQPAAVSPPRTPEQTGAQTAATKTQTEAPHRDDDPRPAPDGAATMAAEPAAAAQQEPAAPITDAAGSGETPAEDTIMCELIINARPDFSETQAPAPPAVTTTTTLRPDRQYTYFNQRDNTLHITADAKTIPRPCRAKLRHIVISPVSFKRLNLRDMSIQVSAEGKTAAVALDGITGAAATPSRQAVRDFEALLQDHPLRMRYHPQRTGPDGTLHGALFFTNGLPVAQEMVRRGIAAWQGP